MNVAGTATEVEDYDDFLLGRRKNSENHRAGR